MGMYTELYMSATLSEDTPAQVLDILKYLFNDAHAPESLPDDEFFKCGRWDFIGNSNSHYFTPFSLSRLIELDYTSGYYFTTRSDLKNYDNEIAKFIKWIMPYLDGEEGNHLGHFRYEEDIAPTFILKEK